MKPDTGLEGEGNHLLLYDGLCGLCNSVNAFVLVHDRRSAFDFASLQSDVGRSWLERFDQNPDALDTFYVVTGYRSDVPGLLSKAAGALFIVRRMSGPWRWLGAFGIVPHAWLDRGYDLISRNRDWLSTRRETCLRPTAEYTKRFIDG